MTIQRTKERALGHDTVADTLLAGYYEDADRLVSRGIANPADIDTAMRLGAGYPHGPFEARHISAEADEPGESIGDSTWNRVAVVGTGRMATGIAEAVGRARIPVVVIGRSESAAETAHATVSASLARAVARGRLTSDEAGGALDRVTFTSALSAASAVDLVIEAVVEDLAAKRRVVADLDGTAARGVPIATNTSSFRVAEIRDAIATERPVLALHFFNPAPAMKLVEIVTAGSDSELDRSAAGFVRAIGKTPVRSADARGFIVNRLLIPFLNHAVRLHEQGVPIEVIDVAIRADAGFPMGPFALIDMIGLDVTIAALASMAEAEHDQSDRLRPATTLYRLVGEGRLGRKSGSGFYTEGT